MRFCCCAAIGYGLRGKFAATAVRDYYVTFSIAYNYLLFA